MVDIFPAGLPQESRPGGPTGSIKERVGYCHDEQLSRDVVQSNYLKVYLQGEQAGQCQTRYRFEGAVLHTLSWQ